MAGSVAKRPNGKWRARYRDTDGNERARHFDRKIDAQRWLDETSASVIAGTYADPQAGKITFAAYFDQWSSRQLWAPGTSKAMSLAVRSTPFSHRRISHIARSDLESWVKGMDSSGLAAGTIKTRFNNVRSVFRAAVSDRVIGSDPTEGVRLPRRRRSNVAMTIPSPREISALLDAADSRFRPFIALCAFAGLRLGEAAAVQLTDLDIPARELRVARQIQREAGGQVEIRRPKYGSERVIYLAGGLVELLARHIDHHGTHGAAGWLFAGTGEDPPHQNTVGYWWRKTQKDAGLSGVKLHDLRHFYASGLIAAGCDVVTVQRSLGHASASTTLSTYAHLWPNAEDRTRRAAESIMSLTQASAAPGAPL